MSIVFELDHIIIKYRRYKVELRLFWYNYCTRVKTRRLKCIRRKKNVRQNKLTLKEQLIRNNSNNYPGVQGTARYTCLFEGMRSKVRYSD